MAVAPAKRGKPSPGKRLASKSTASLSDLVAEIAIAFVRCAVADIDDEVNRSLERVALALGLDRSTITEFKPDGSAVLSHGWAADQEHLLTGRSLDANVILPWLKTRMLAGETVIVSSVNDLPKAATIDRQSYRRYGTKSNVNIPIKAGGSVLAAVGFGYLHREHTWPPKLVQQLRRVAEIFGYAFERKRIAAEMLRLRSELTHVARVNTMGELAASMAHELNQPLAAILSNAEAIQGMLQSENVELEEVRAAIDDIVHDDIRAGETIRRLRALFRRDDLRKADLDLAEVVDEIGRLVRSDAQIHNVSFTVAAQQQPVVRADRVQLQQAIINLVLNAFDAVASAEREPREVSIEVVPRAPGRVAVLVRDSGAGIPAAMLPRIFDAFFTTKPTGLGMGLAISRSIIEAHGGRLSVSSAPGRGTIFEASLPSAVSPHP
jgi:signal transduction histidine kinase